MLYTVGIDEVGRGALAGPVVVAIVALPKKWRAFHLKDSKKLTPRAREKFFKYTKERPFILYAVSRVYPKKIDSINITAAANLAAIRSFNRLTKNPKLKTKNCKIFLDGGLYFKKLKTKNYKLKAKTIIKGDEKINAIKLASIVAKVTRDRYMIKLHEFYPNYGFNIHKGYGTKLHRRAIRRYGLSKVHRRSFKTV